MRGAGSAQINTNTHLIKTPRPERLLLNSTDRPAERHWQRTGNRRRERRMSVSCGRLWPHSEILFGQRNHSKVQPSLRITLECKRYDFIVQVNAKKKKLPNGPQHDVTKLHLEHKFDLVVFIILIEKLGIICHPYVENMSIRRSAVDLLY